MKKRQQNIELLIMLMIVIAKSPDFGTYWILSNILKNVFKITTIESQVDVIFYINTFICDKESKFCLVSLEKIPSL